MISEQERIRIAEDEVARIKAREHNNAGLALLGFGIVIALQLACWWLLDFVIPSILGITVLIAIIIMIVWLTRR